MEIDNEETCGSESSSALAKTAMKMMSAGSAEVMQIDLNGYQILWSKTNKQRTKYTKCVIENVFTNQVRWKRNWT